MGDVVEAVDTGETDEGAAEEAVGRKRVRNTGVTYGVRKMEAAVEPLTVSDKLGGAERAGVADTEDDEEWEAAAGVGKV